MSCSRTEILILNPETNPDVQEVRGLEQRAYSPDATIRAGEELEASTLSGTRRGTRRRYYSVTPEEETVDETQEEFDSLEKEAEWDIKVAIAAGIEFLRNPVKVTKEKWGQLKERVSSEVDIFKENKTKYLLLRTPRFLFRVMLSAIILSPTILAFIIASLTGGLSAPLTPVFLALQSLFLKIPFVILRPAFAAQLMYKHAPKKEMMGAGAVALTALVFGAPVGIIGALAFAGALAVGLGRITKQIK